MMYCRYRDGIILYFRQVWNLNDINFGSTHKTPITPTGIKNISPYYFPYNANSTSISGDFKQVITPVQPYGPDVTRSVLGQ